MVLWASHLFIGNKMKKKQKKAIVSINQREATFEIYCITFASNPNNLFDIMNANELLFPHYQRIEVNIVGLAKGKQEAIDLVQKMLMEVYKKTGGFDVRAYFT